MDAIKSKLQNAYYSPKGYYKGLDAINKLAKETKVNNKLVSRWIKKQALWQIYLSYPKYIPRPTSSNSTLEKPNEVHQADLLFLPHDSVNKKTYKYALTVVDEASRYKEAEPLTDKTASQVSNAFILHVEFS